MRSKLMIPAIAAAVLATASCSSTTEAPQEVTVPPATTVSDTDLGPEDVAIKALETAYTVYPQREEPGASWDRARALLDPAGTFPRAAGGQTHGMGQWLGWQADGIVEVRARAELAADNHPPDTADRLQRVVFVDRTAVHADGHTTPVDHLPHYVTVARTSQGWRLLADSVQ